MVSPCSGNHQHHRLLWGSLLLFRIQGGSLRPVPPPVTTDPDDHDPEGMNSDRVTTLGTCLILLGVSVWGVYAVCRWGFGWEVSGRHFLGFHLAGVIPGSILSRWRLLKRLFK